MTAAAGPLPKIIGSSHCPSSLTTKGLHLRSVQPLFLIGWVRKSASLTPSPQWQFFVPKSDVSVFLSEFVSDPRPQVTRPAPAGHTTRARRSRDPRARVADFLGKKNGNVGFWIENVL